MRSLVEAGKPVVIFTSSPASYILDPQIGFRRLSPFRLENFHSVSWHGLEQFLAPLNGRLERVARNSGAEIVNPLDSLCRGDECPAVGEDGSPIYRDGQHLRASKAVNLAYFVDDVLRS